MPIEEILTTTTTWAVVGLSANQRRAAWGVSLWLQERGKRIVPVHHAFGKPIASGSAARSAHDAHTVHGEPGYATLGEIPFPVDVVDVFVRSALAGGVVDQAIAIGARAVWLQLGVRDDAAIARAEAAGLLAVQDHCPHIEGPRRLGWPA